MGNRIVVKVQSVRTFELVNNPKTKNPYTVGQQIDNLINDSRNDGQIPNKIVIDLNPPPAPNPASIDDAVIDVDN